MPKRNSTGWQLIVGDDGYPIWERRLGDVVARVASELRDGAVVWRYNVVCYEWHDTGVYDTVRKAKIRATKALFWYGLRQDDFKRVKTRLRLLWASQGLEDVDPVPGNAWDERADQVPVHGILWKWISAERAWYSGAWRLWHDQHAGWLLRHPDGYHQTIHVTDRYDAMREAAFWISLAIG